VAEFITCSAVALSIVLRIGLGSLWQHGNFKSHLTPHSSETSQVTTTKLCTFDTSVRQTHLPSLVGVRPLGVAPRIREIYTSCDFSSFLPFFLRTCTGQTDRGNFTLNGSKDAVWRKEVSSHEVFVSHLTFWGSFCPQPPNFRPPVGTSQPNKKKSNNV